MSEQRKISKQLYETHFPYTDSEIAWTAWKMAFDLGVSHQKKQLPAAENPTDKSGFVSVETDNKEFKYSIG